MHACDRGCCIDLDVVAVSANACSGRRPGDSGLSNQERGHIIRLSARVLDSLDRYHLAGAGPCEGPPALRSRVRSPGVRAAPPRRTSDETRASNSACTPASVSRCSGFCASGAPKAILRVAKSRASARPRRISATALTLFHVRVTLSIGAMFFTPSLVPQTSSRGRAFELELGGRDLARPELVLQAIDEDAVRDAPERRASRRKRAQAPCPRADCLRAAPA